MKYKYRRRLIIIKTKRWIALLTALAMAVTTMFMGTVAVFAEETATEAGLAWYFKDSSNSAMTGVSSPVLDGESLYMASAKNLYKINAQTGELVETAALTGSVGYNKLAPTVADTRSGKKIFVPLGASQLNIVDADTMEVEKSLTYKEGQSGHQSLTPAVYSASDNSVYLGSWRKLRDGADYIGGTYVKVSLDDYTITELIDAPYGFYWSGAYVNDDYVIFGSSSNGTDDPNTPSDGDSSLYVYNKATGEIKETVMGSAGCICSSVKEYNGKFYVVSKSGQVHEIEIIDGAGVETRSIMLAGKSTCTPTIKEGQMYVGSENNVEVIDMTSFKVVKTYGAPGDVKSVALKGDKIYATYNNKIGGIYDITEDKDYFIPAEEMQNYCISTIAQSEDGTLYYTNDSNNLMAVKEYTVPDIAAQKTVTAKLYGYDDFQITWNSQTVKLNNGASQTLPVKYKVEYKKYSASKWTVAKSAATGTSYKKANLSDGTRYAFRVTPYVTINGRMYSGTAKTTSYQYTLKATKKPVVKKSSSKYVKVSWSKVYGITGYKVYRSKYSSKNFKLVKTVKAGNLSTKIKTSKKVKYYYRVRPYKVVGKTTILGPWSATSKAYTLK